MHAWAIPVLRPLSGNMPFYQVLCIAAHNPEYVRHEAFGRYFIFSAPQRQIKGLVRLAASHILNNGGVLRGIQYWGTETLPQRMRSHGINHEHGECAWFSLFLDLSLRFFSISYWTMDFDSSPEKQKSLSKLLRKDPRVVRATVLKMGERIEDVAWKYPKTIIPARDISKVPY